MRPPEVLEVAGLTAGYGAVTVIRDVSFTVQPSEIVAIVGANGAGKTTLLRALSGALRPRGGRVAYGRHELSGRPQRVAITAGIGHAPQGRHLFPSMTVRENLELGLYPLPHRERAAVRDERLAYVRDLFPILGEFDQRRAGELSGGQQQMVSLARALMCAPSLVMLDEPSLGLAPAPLTRIMDAVQTLRSSGVSILLVEQMVDRALALADRALVLRAGAVSWAGASAELLRDPALLERTYFGETLRRPEDVVAPAAGAVDATRTPQIHSD